MPVKVCVFAIISFLFYFLKLTLTFLFTKTATRQKLDCLNSEDQKPGTVASLISGCRVTRYDKWNGKHEEGNLVNGEMYFFLAIVAPTDEGAFVFVSGTHRGPNAAPVTPKKTKAVYPTPSPTWPRVGT